MSLKVAEVAYEVIAELRPLLPRIKRVGSLARGSAAPRGKLDGAQHRRGAVLGSRQSSLSLLHRRGQRQ